MLEIEFFVIKLLKNMALKRVRVLSAMKDLVNFLCDPELRPIDQKLRTNIYSYFEFQMLSAENK